MLVPAPLQQAHMNKKRCTCTHSPPALFLMPRGYALIYAQDTVLARLWTAARTLRVADGPDEVHLVTVAKMELARASKL